MCRGLPPAQRRAGGRSERAVGARRANGQAATARPPDSRARAWRFRRPCSWSSPLAPAFHRPGAGAALECVCAASRVALARNQRGARIVPRGAHESNRADEPAGVLPAPRSRRARRTAVHGHAGFAGAARALRHRRRGAVRRLRARYRRLITGEAAVTGISTGRCLKRLPVNVVDKYYLGVGPRAASCSAGASAIKAKPMTTRAATPTNSPLDTIFRIA